MNPLSEEYIREIKKAFRKKLHGFKRLGTGLGGIGGLAVGGTAGLANSVIQDQKGKIDDEHRLQAYMHNMMKGGLIGGGLGAGVGFGAGVYGKQRATEALAEPFLQKMQQVHSLHKKFPIPYAEDALVHGIGLAGMGAARIAPETNVQDEFLDRVLHRNDSHITAPVQGVQPPSALSGVLSMLKQSSSPLTMYKQAMSAWRTPSS